MRKFKAGDHVLYNGKEFIVSNVDKTCLKIIPRFRPYMTAKHVLLKDVKINRHIKRRSLKAGDFVNYSLLNNNILSYVIERECDDIIIQPLYIRHRFRVSIYSNMIGLTDATLSYTPVPDRQTDLLDKWGVDDNGWRGLIVDEDCDLILVSFISATRRWIQKDQFTLDRERVPAKYEKIGEIHLTEDEIPISYYKYIDDDSIKRAIYRSYFHSNHKMMLISYIIECEEELHSYYNSNGREMDRLLLEALIRQETINVEQLQMVRSRMDYTSRENNVFLERYIHHRPRFKSVFRRDGSNIVVDIYHLDKIHRYNPMNAEVYWYLRDEETPSSFIPTPKCNPDLKIPLKPFQEKIVSDMIRREATANYPMRMQTVEGQNFNIVSGRDMSNMIRGGILHMDTGMGKTICILALLSNPSITKEKTLVVVPLTLMDQWISELKRFTSLDYGEIHGRNKNVKKALENDVVFTTYKTVMSIYNTGILSDMFWGFDRVVFDESHEMKMVGSKTVEACNAIQTTYRWCLTATPYRNGRIVNLQPQLRMLNIRPFHRDKKYLSTIYKDTERNRYIMKKINSIILRGEGVELQQPIRKEIYLETTPEHRQLYNLFSQILSEKLYKLEYTRGGLLGNYKKIHAMINQLSMCAIDPTTIPLTEWGELIEGTLKCSNKEFQESLNKNNAFESEIIKTIEDINDTSCALCLETIQRPTVTNCLHIFCNSCIHQAIEFNSKCPMCRTELNPEQFRELTPNDTCKETEEFVYRNDVIGREVKISRKVSNMYKNCVSMKHKQLSYIIKNHKRVVVFSQFNNVLDKYSKMFPCSIITGRSSRNQRKRNIEDFKTGKTSVFFLATKVANVGINLCEADCLVFMEPGLDKTMEKQAIGRLKRIGQQKQVQVYHMFMKDTIEDRIIYYRTKYYEIMEKTENENISASSKRAIRKAQFFKYLLNVIHK